MNQNEIYLGGDRPLVSDVGTNTLGNRKVNQRRIEYELIYCLQGAMHRVGFSFHIQ